MTPQEQNEMRALEYFYDQEEAGTLGSIGELRRRFGDNEGGMIAVSLKQANLIMDVARGGGHYQITSDGRASVEKLRERQGDRGHRRKVCRELLLRWIDSNTAADDAGSRVARLQFDGSEDLLPFSDEETSAAATYLSENGLIKSINASGVKHVLVWITARGQEAVDAGGVERFLAHAAPTGSTTNFHVSGSGHTFATATAPGAVANANITNFNLDVARLFAAAVRTAEADLVLDDHAREALTEIETTDDVEKASKATKFLHAFLVPTATGTVGQILGMLGAAAFGIGS